jgi:hypothetical protein
MVSEQPRAVTVSARETKQEKEAAIGFESATAAVTRGTADRKELAVDG